MPNSIQGFRLSPQQERLWWLQQEHEVYRAQCTVTLAGALNPAVLAEAIRQVVARHEMLRTTFHRHDGMQVPLQCVAESSLPSWHQVDLRAWRAPQQAAHIETFLQRERHRPFDLEHGPLCRVALLVLSASRHVLCLTLPALCADAGSLQHLLRDISQAYATGLQGQQLSDAPLPYLHFSEWQNALLEDEDAEGGKNYWHKQDLTALPPLSLPLAKKTDGKAGFAPDVFLCVLDPHLVAQLRALAQQYDTSLPACLLASWQMLLWRLTGRPDIVVGYVCDGRKYPELHRMLGLLAKWVPLHCRVAESYAFHELVERVQASMQEAYEWQEYFAPHQRHGLAGGAVDMSIGFEFAARPGTYEAAGVSLTIDQQFVCYERFTVHLVCTQQDEDLMAAFYYDTAAFDVKDMRCLAGQFQTVLASATSNPEASIGTLGMLSQEERQRLLVEGNNTSTAYPTHTCMHHLFEAQAARTPEKIAVVCEEQYLTYAALNARANQLAHYLQRLGVGPETRVAMCLERSLETVVGLLGIVKSAGAYVPLDPVQPQERLAFMVADTQAPIVVTQQRLRDRFLQDGMQVVCLDQDWDVVAQESDANPLRRATSENLIYVMYTSGSTGKPKGVAVEHRQLLNYLYAIVDRLELSPDLSYAVVSTFAADLGHTTLFSALCLGGCLHIVAQEGVFAPEALADYCSRHPIDCLKIVPSHLAGLLTSSRPAHVLPRQRLVLGGEACGWDFIETLQALVPGCRIFNHYGPTEATVGVLTYQVEPDSTDQRAVQLPLGRPLANTQIYILDAHLQPVPVGVPGELCIGGAGLVRGYLYDRQLTAEKFIPNPFSDTPGARLYKTGDRGRFLPDGSIEFLGRFDHQVKLRGFRIELGEIEVVLSRHPAIREVVVVAREDGSGNTQLVAYIVLHQAHAPTIQELRRFVQERLPDYMVPSTLVFLPALPLTANGKVNRHALPAPDQAAAELPGHFVAPRTPVEEVVAGIWSEVLGRQQVGVHDNFFELGGHSLLAIQVLSRARQAFHVEVPPRELFEAPTVVGLVEALIKHEAKPGLIGAMARLRQEIDQRSAEDIQALLRDKRQTC